MAVVTLLWLSVTCACVLYSFFGLPSSTQHFLSDYKNHWSTQTVLTPAFAAPKPNVWIDLTDAESAQIIKYLHVTNPTLGLTSAENATSWDNAIISMEALAPFKKDTVPFLDGDGVEPPRFARVVVNQGASQQPLICEYQVGPLPITEASNMLPLTNGHTNGEHCVPNPLPGMDHMQTWFQDASLGMQDVLATLLGDVIIYGEDGIIKNLILGGRMQRSQKTDNPHHTHLWTELHSRNQAFSLLPQGLYLNIDVTSRNTSNWEVLSCFYNGKMYKSLDTLHAAAKEPGFSKSAPNINDGWVDTVDWSTANDHDDEAPPPVMIQPGM
jgi:primary-amine oxidase